MATTTPKAIRDRMLTVVAALTPTSLPRDKFIAYRNEGDAEFIHWAESSPEGAFRRFQIRTTQEDRLVEVSNTDVEQHYVICEVTVAYPRTARAGKKWALDRDDLMDEDQSAIDKAIGLCGTANFATPYPDATYRDEMSELPARVKGTACDYLSFTYAYSYMRTR